MFIRIDSSEKLSQYFDEISDGLVTIFRKGGEHGASAMSLAKLTIALSGLPNGFVLVHLDPFDKVDGFLLALGMKDEVNPWIEVLALWAKPGTFKNVEAEGCKMLEEWGRGFGCKKITTIATRKYRTLVKKFYGPLGYKVKGVFIEKEL